MVEPPPTLPGAECADAAMGDLRRQMRGAVPRRRPPWTPSPDPRSKPRQPLHSGLTSTFHDRITSTELGLRSSLAIGLIWT
ncbi:serine/arginine repetitive matrix protein 1-like [Iris pallida]|uniref:Serine/arginine repetitive matrix protein 1-like n=1 Tax=Iris pallida TaxID=29817 RepID=A0AAX6F6Y6_IRIPA|nr:serine/arginine repetitive matrix protein 1-like [Iris pallida]